MTKKSLFHLELMGYYIGKIIIGLGYIQIIPIITAFFYAEWNILFNFIISGSISLMIGCMLVFLCKGAKSKKLGWSHGMAVTALSWFIGMILAAIPYYMSNNYLSYLDACFDVMSGFTTTGLTLIQDLDHVSNGVNMWRHVLTFVGGQGMVVLALTFLVRGTSGAYKMYVGEAKDEQLLPNAISTARAIWAISIVYLIIGTIVLWVLGISIGMNWDRAFLHSLWVYMAAWSTGGFAPQSQNILYYHDMYYEIATMIFFIVGSFNFALHYAVLTGKRKELFKNIELISLTITVSVLTIITVVGLMRLKVYPDVMAMFRKGFYHLISGHTTTGYMTIYAKQFYNEWGELALFAMIIAMLIGASACSTAGGLKGLRLGIIFKAFVQDINRMVMPESMVSIQKFHHIKDVVLEERHVRSAMIIVFAYILTFVIGTLGGMIYGYPFASAAFEAASVTGNVGLSIGLTQASMPTMLKVLYIIIIWLARLEFISVLALGTYVYYGVKKRWAK